MFVAAAETGSFSAAARSLGKGQSAVSLGIANLEIDLGFDLFDRTTRRPGLTAAGERLLAHAQAVIQQVRNLDSVASAVSSAEETRVRLVVDDAILLPSLSRVLVEFGDRFRATQIEFSSAASPEIPDVVRSGGAEIGLMFSGLQVQRGIEQVFIGNLPFISVSRPGHPLASQKAITANDLLSHRQLLQRSVQGGLLEQFPRLSPDVWYATSFHAIRELVLQGVGWAYLPEHLVSGAIASGQLVKLDLRFEHKHWSPPVERVTSKQVRQGPALAWLSEATKNLFP